MNLSLSVMWGWGYPGETQKGSLDCRGLDGTSEVGPGVEPLKLVLVWRSGACHHVTVVTYWPGATLSGALLLCGSMGFPEPWASRFPSGSSPWFLWPCQSVLL